MGTRDGRRLESEGHLPSRVPFPLYCIRNSFRRGLPTRNGADVQTFHRRTRSSVDGWGLADYTCNMVHVTNTSCSIRRIRSLLTLLEDPIRLRLLRLLLRQELCVCELVDALRLPQYKVSRHLRQLRAVGLVQARREGRWMHYRRGPLLKARGMPRDLLDVLDRHLLGTPEARKDDARLMRRLALRRAGRCIVGLRCG